MPETAKVDVQPAKDPRGEPGAGPQMGPTYMGGKAGGAAYVADKILNGWMAGRKVANEKAETKAIGSVRAAKSAYEALGDDYQTALRSGDTAKAEKLKVDLNATYQNYLDVAEKYAIPDDMGKKKSTGDKIKGGLKRAVGMGENPHIDILHSTIDHLRKRDISEQYQPSKQEQQQTKLTDMQLSRMESDEAAHKRWEQVAQTDPAKQTPEDKKFLEWYEYEKFGKTGNDRKKDELLGLVMDGKLASSGPQHDLAVQLGLVRPDVISTQMRQIAGPGGKPTTQLIAIGPDGKMVGQPQTLPGNDYVAPNQAQMAGQVINSQVTAMANWAKKAHPDWDDKTRYQYALSTVAGGGGGGGTGGADWFQKNQEQDVMNRALKAVMDKHHHYSKDGGDAYDGLGSALVGNYIVPDGSGRYAWTPSLKPKEHTGVLGMGAGPDTYGPYTAEQMRAYENQGRAELRATLRAQNPKLSDGDIDKMVPPSAFDGQGKAMQPAPAAPGQPTPQGGSTDPAQQASNQVPPPMGAKKYNVFLEGKFESRMMTDEQVEKYRSRGIKIVPQ